MTSDSLAERVSGWWVARVSPAHTLRFAQSLGEETYIPLGRPSKKDNIRRPIVSYVFVRAIGQSRAWMFPCFKGWFNAGPTRAFVSDPELNEFRSMVESQNALTARRNGERLLRKFSGNQDFVDA
jgi:hypothetical protein